MECLPFMGAYLISTQRPFLYHNTTLVAQLSLMERGMSYENTIYDNLKIEIDFGQTVDMD